MKNKFVYSVATLALLSQSLLAAKFAPADSVVDFQPFRKEQAMAITDASGHNSMATLVNLNSNINALYVLSLHGFFSDKHYALEVPNNKNISLSLNGSGLYLKNSVTGVGMNCDLSADDSSLPYVGICNDQVYIRNTTTGYAGEKKELVANLLRNSLGKTGENIIEQYKEQHEDGNLVTGTETAVDANGLVLGHDPNRPARAQISDQAMSTSITASNMGIAIKETASTSPLAIGEWYSAKNEENIYVSLIQGQSVAPEILNKNLDRASKLDDIEKTALDYMVAFDLNNFEMGWSHGTGLPGVAWSKRENLKIDASLPGPDGFGDLIAVQPTGILNPALLNRLVATMCGGFQRLQGVFHAGDLGSKNFGSYYGFIEDGVMYSHLNPGLATLIMTNDGQISMKTWTEADDATIANIRFARQNGVPLVEQNNKGESIPGQFVNSWSLGNWSGSPDRTIDAPVADEVINGVAYKNFEDKQYPIVDGKITVLPELRSARAGACISEQNGHRFLIYGYFSDVKPSSMARVFQAYGCQYAMHLDMNSPGQGYMGIMTRKASGQSIVESPVSEMAAMNSGMKYEGKFMTLPRYVGKADNADFFYILRKKAN